jgi:hypothetical protein
VRQENILLHEIRIRSYPRASQGKSAHRINSEKILNNRLEDEIEEITQKINIKER